MLTMGGGIELRGKLDQVYLDRGEDVEGRM